MPKDELPLLAHLFRRAGFGATQSELETAAAQGYAATVEQLLHPEQSPPLADLDLLRRYHPDQHSLMLIDSAQAYWLYRIINTRRPLEEKIALFWHGLFATAYGKLNHAKAVVNQTDTFRRCGLGDFRTLLLELSQDPAMLFWLDNKDNHKDAPNENYGRELLELFSLGIGNYTEADVKACARAFTGWTIANADYMSIRAARDSIWPHGRLDWQFVYDPADHDATDKTFLGHTGPFDGAEVIAIICRQPATAWFIAGKLYNFFVADTPDETAIQYLADEFQRTDGNIRSVLRALFMSDFFRSPAARRARVKSPAELVAGTARRAGSHRFPDWSIVNLAMDANFMGQEILNPPTVEGWHTGLEWIDTGSLVERVNAAALEIGDLNQPGVQEIIARIRETASRHSRANGNPETGPELSPEQLVDACLAALGQYELTETTRQTLLDHARQDGSLNFDRRGAAECAAQRIAAMLQLIVATREYQLA